MARALDLVSTIPRPQPYACIGDPERVGALRRLDCARYDACLDVAAAGRWHAFVCGAGCYVPLSASERTRDAEGLLALAGAIFGASDEDGDGWFSKS
jgi:hypothetical protein